MSAGTSPIKSSPSSDFYKLQQAFNTFYYGRNSFEQTVEIFVQGQLTSCGEELRSSQSSDEGKEPLDQEIDLLFSTQSDLPIDFTPIPSESSQRTEKTPLKTTEKTQSAFESCLDAFLSLCCCR